MVEMPGHSWRGAMPLLTADEMRTREELRRHVRTLAGDIGARTAETGIEIAAEYLCETLSALGYTTSELPYTVGAFRYRNIRTEIPGSSGEVVVVGAHYDTAGPYPGANDNASGVAAVLELARVLKDAKPRRTVRFVLFPNEEPPFFMGPEMGSFVYARRCRERGDKITAMLSLETIGYYSDEPGSQVYPFPAGTYPTTANFIGFVGNPGSRSLLRECMRVFRETTRFPSEGIAAPAVIPGVGWSDHWSFWQHGYPAIMVTDTAPYRYPYYHSAEDTPDKLDYDRMARVVRGIERVVRALAGE
ncbi:MAG TPA: M28 family peptidase [Bryobacteraceae bacterium]|nr:M28 family peptidase [Bryobacteraceae bacterium]